MHTIVVAHLARRAQAIVTARKLGRSAVAVSPRSIRDGAVRGLTGVTAILVAASAWPLDDDVRDELAFTTLASPGDVTPTLIR